MGWLDYNEGMEFLDRYSDEDTGPQLHLTLTAPSDTTPGQGQLHAAKRPAIR